MNRFYIILFLAFLFFGCINNQTTSDVEFVNDTVPKNESLLIDYNTSVQNDQQEMIVNTSTEENISINLTKEEKQEEYVPWSSKKIKSYLPSSTPYLTGIKKGYRSMAIFVNQDDYSISAYNAYSYVLGDGIDMKLNFQIFHLENGVESKSFYDNCTKNARDYKNYTVCFLDGSGTPIEEVIYTDADSWKSGTQQTYVVYLIIDKYTYASVMFSSYTFNIANYLLNRNFQPFYDALDGFNL